MKRPLILFSLIIILSALSSCSLFTNKNKKNVKFIVHTTILPDSANVFLTGSSEELGSWETGKIKLNKVNSSTWETTLALPAGESYEYKFTLGSWQSEALDSNRQVPPNNKITVLNDTVINLDIKNWNSPDAGFNFFLTKSVFKSSKYFHLFSYWNYYPDDNPVYASPQFADSGYIKVPSLLYEETQSSIKWNGKGWLRAIIRVDSALWGKQTALCIRQTGASEVYLNGKKILTLGKIGANSSETVNRTDASWHIITWDSCYNQVLSVRYANYYIPKFLSQGFPGGFIITLRMPQNIVESSQIVEIKPSNVIFTVVPFVLALLHFVMFIFYPKNKQNLYYSFCLLGFTFLAVLNYLNLAFTIHNPFISLMLYRFAHASVLNAAFFGLMTTYSGLYKKLPRQYIYFMAAAVILSVWGIIERTQMQGYFIYAYYGLVFIEVMRTFVKDKRPEKSGMWISISGFVILLIAIAAQTLIELQIINSIFGETLVYGYGVFGLIIFMSLYLSHSFSATNKNLEKQLINVKTLNDLALEQERKAKDEEIKKQMLEADNRRKTVELEEARELQLSMLPKKIPELPQCSIAVYMQTATEVGGDYYDFSNGNENTLTIALGDATGHGAKAGIMVAAAKSLFNALAENPDTIQILRKFTSAIKSMNLHNLYMAMEIGKLKGRVFTFSNAGMPPLLHYSAKEKSIALLVQKSMPLGSFTEFPYAKTVLSLEPDDIVLFLSDGCTEAFNPDDELLGIDRCKEILLKYAALTPQEIIEGFKTELAVWSAGRAQEDDVSIIAVKMN
jgi:serine phosphatase RsbU (regulator of sigma subunit)